MRHRLALAALGGAGLYLFARPWVHRWGTTGEETVVPLPGDDIIAAPRHETTHAVTVDAPIDEVWRRVVDGPPPCGLAGVAEVDGPTTLVLRAPDGSATCAYELHQHEGDGTRIVVRFRTSHRWAPLAPVRWAMQRRMLVGLKERAAA